MNAPLAIDPPAVVSNDGSTVKLTIHATAQLAQNVQPIGVAERIRGMDAATAQAVLRKLPGVGEADVQLWPSWVTRAPSLTWRIHVDVANAPQ